jgi:hypothetical protein
MRYPNVDMRIIRNRWNIGLVANVLRCFENCDTEWIWVPGDDDIMTPDAVHSVLAVMQEYPNACYLNFLTEGLKSSSFRRSTFVTRGLSEFAQRMESAHHVNFMSCSIWRTETFGRVLAAGFHNAYSNGWTFALLLSALKETSEVVFSDKAVVQLVTTAPHTTRWSYRKFVLGWVTLLEIACSRRDRMCLAKKMLRLYSPENVTAYLLADAAVNAWTDRFLYYDLAAGRLLPYRVHFLGRFRFALYRPLFLAPKFGWRLVRTVIVTANRLGLKHVDLADMEGRGV